MPIRAKVKAFGTKVKDTFKKTADKLRHPSKVPPSGENPPAGNDPNEVELIEQVPPPNPALPKIKFKASPVEVDAILMKKYSGGTFRQESWEMAEESLLPHLEGTPPLLQPDGIQWSVILLGDGYLGNLHWHGLSKNGELGRFPSPRLIPDARAKDLAKAQNIPTPFRRPTVFNLGIPGDSTLNVIARLSRSHRTNALDEPKSSLWDVVKSQSGNLRLWVIHVGRMDIAPGLQYDPEPLYVLIMMLFINSHPDTKVLLTGLFYSRNIPNGLIDQINVQFQLLVGQFREKIGNDDRIQFLHSPDWFDPRTDLIDDDDMEEKLTEKAYARWMETLVPKMWRMVGVGRDDGY